MCAIFRPVMSTTSQTKNIEAAIELASKLHAGQIDRDGMPHIVHVAAVASSLPEHLQPAGWLHDVVEDTHVCIEAIYLQFGAYTGGMVELLTWDKDKETYDQYITRMITSDQGVITTGTLTVKQKDAAHNLKRCIESGDVCGVEKYSDVYVKVTSALECMGAEGEG